MKNLYKWMLGVAFVTSLGACTDDFDDTNKNPNKIYDAKMESVFPGVVYKSMYTLNEMNFRWFATLAQYNVHWAEQKDTEDFNYFEGLYVKALTDLGKLEDNYVGAEGYRNTGNIVLTYKCYLYYLMATTWGNVPYTEANNTSILQSYRYDSQHEIFRSLLETLDGVVSTFDVNGDRISRDPLFDGSIDKWRKFANSLRLMIALTVQNMDGELARTHIGKAFAGENANYLLDSDAVFQFGTDLNSDGAWSYKSYMQQFELGTNSGFGTYPCMSHNFFLYMKSYDDPRLPKFAQIAEGDAMCLLQNDTLTRVNPDYPQFRDSLIVNYGVPYCARRDYKEQPSGWTVATDPNSPNGEQYRSPFSNIQKGSPENECFVNYDFLDVDAIMPLITVAEVNFMKAEIAIKYSGIVSGSAQSYYEEGVRASMKQWNVSDSDAAAYLESDGVKWNTNGSGLWEYRRFFKADIKGQGGDENHLEQIYKQWYIADFFCGHAGWTLERRTRAVGFPPHFFNGTVPTEGSNGVCEYMMERMTYPIKEQSANTVAWQQACTDLQRESPMGNPVRNGDNYFTLLSWAAPQPDGGNLDKWLEGEIIFDGSFIYHWYGRTLEEMLANVGASNEAELARKIRYQLITVKSTYDPATGKVMVQDEETGEWKEKENED